MIALATPDFIQHEPDKVYHSKAKENLSSHQLADFRKSPWLHRKKKLGLIPDSESTAFLLGRAAHSLILEGRDAFEDGFVVGGTINPKTGNAYGPTSKAYAKWLKEQGKPGITMDQLALIESMAGGVAMNDAALELLATGVAEGVIRTGYQDLPCQSRMDWFSPTKGLVDLKTCEDLTWFESDARRYGYIHQMAFYRALLQEVTGDRSPVHIIAVEKREPYRCGVWRIGEDILGIAQKDNEAAITRLKCCINSDIWPSGYEEVRTFDHL